MRKELKRSHEIVWRFRDEAEEWWPLPPPIDCLRFAVTEAGEALDALLRQNTRYIRNTPSDSTIAEELADCAIMLLSAYADFDFESIEQARINRAGWDHGRQLTEIAYRAAFALRCYEDNLYIVSKEQAAFALCEVVDYPGMDLPTEIEKRLSCIQRKHGPQVDPNPGVSTTHTLEREREARGDKS